MINISAELFIFFPATLEGWHFFYFALECEVRGFGRHHINRRKRVCGEDRVCFKIGSRVIMSVATVNGKLHYLSSAANRYKE